MIHTQFTIIGRKTAFTIDKNGIYNFYRYKEVLNIVKNPNFSREIAERKNDVFYSVLDSDLDYHAKLRKNVSLFFKQKYINDIKNKIETLVSNKITTLKDKQSADLINDYSYTIPFEMISIILGIPKIDQKSIKEMAGDVTNALDLDYMDEKEFSKTLEKHQSAMTNLTIFMADVLEYKKSNKSDDIISYFLLNKELSKGEILTFCMLLYIAGFETTANVIGNSLYAILSDEVCKLHVLKYGISANATEELLRYNTSVHRVLRKAIDNIIIEIDGNYLEIESGSKVFAHIAAANRDERIFENPNIIDFNRKNANKNLSFSAGPHYCLGSFLAKEEIKISVEKLFQAFPQMSLTDDYMWKSSKTLRGLKKMVVSLN